jgi:hypothetical protein
LNSIKSINTIMPIVLSITANWNSLDNDSLWNEL